MRRSVFAVVVVTTLTSASGLRRSGGGGQSDVFHVQYRDDGGAEDDDVASSTSPEVEVEAATSLTPWWEDWTWWAGHLGGGKDALPVPDMIRSYGYECEVHSYTTADGYVNTLHRIPPRKDDAVGKAVFLQHGLLGTSADFVMGRPDKSLGYVLSDLGYDVWLGNARGNAYSRAHVSLSVNSDEYWKFSFDEMGKYDLPAALEYAVEASKSDKLQYVGHSMGTVMFWVAMNEEQERVEAAVSSAVAMGPVATVAHMDSPIKYVAQFSDNIEELFKILGIREFSPANWVTRLFDRVACDRTMRQLKLCEDLVFLLVGFDAKQANMTLLPIILAHEPGGTSTRTVIHFAQEYKSGRFCKYDHGPRENVVLYNSTSPPDYDLSKVTVPVYLMYADNDWLADERDVEYLFSLPNLRAKYLVPYRGFNHIDFLWGVDADSLVYPKLVEFLREGEEEHS